MGIGNPPGIHRGTGSTDRGAKARSQLLNQLEILRFTQPPSPRNDNIGILKLHSLGDIFHKVEELGTGDNALFGKVYLDYLALAVGVRGVLLKDAGTNRRHLGSFYLTDDGCHDIATKGGASLQEEPVLGIYVKSGAVGSEPGV